MTYLLYLLILSNFFFSCKKAEPYLEPTVKKYTILALGDSYTIGESVSPAERFPVQLADSLRKNKMEMEDPKIIATTGWTTGDLLNGIKGDGVKGTFDYVFLL